MTTAATRSSHGCATASRSSRATLTAGLGRSWITAPPIGTTRSDQQRCHEILERGVEFHEAFLFFIIRMSVRQHKDRALLWEGSIARAAYQHERPLCSTIVLTTLATEAFPDSKTREFMSHRPPRPHYNRRDGHPNHESTSASRGGGITPGCLTGLLVDIGAAHASGHGR